MRGMVVVLAFLTAVVSSEREPKWFLPRQTVTRFVHEQRLLTELVPSSCVVLESSLKPCRHLRQIKPTAPSQVPKILMTPTPRLSSSPSAPLPLRGSHDESDTSAVRSWSSYLGLDPVTVTHTLTQLLTARSASPAAVVTFSVRGCHPSRLPFGLPLCSDANTTVAATATARISSTKDVHYIEEEAHKPDGS